MKRKVSSVLKSIGSLALIVGIFFFLYWAFWAYALVVGVASASQPIPYLATLDSWMFAVPVLFLVLGVLSIVIGRLTKQ